MTFSRVRWLLLLLALPLAACDSGTDEPPDTNPPVEDTGRGSIVASSLVETVTQATITSFGFPVSARFEVEIHQVIYRTIDPAGNETTASGAVFVPVGATGGLPLASYQHGTVYRKVDVASVGGTAVPESLIGIILATDGYFAAMPDYLGLGTSAGLHPYVHSASLATATVDLLRAARRFATAEEIDLNDQVFLMGYSEGGHATMAAHRLLEAEHTDEFTLTAVAPMAGSYDLSGTMANRILDPTPFGSPAYLPYLILAYDDVYNLYDDPAEVFLPPYPTRLPELFDGTRSGGVIEAELPDVPTQILVPAYLDDFVNRPTEHPLRLALRDNDLYGWTPQAPTRMYHCEADELVPFANSEVALAAFQSRGAANVELIRLTAGGHGECAAPALLFGKLWFDTFRLAAAPPPIDAPVWHQRLLAE